MDEYAVEMSLRDLFMSYDYDDYKLIDDPDSYGEDGPTFRDLTLSFINAYVQYSGEG